MAIVNAVNMLRDPRAEIIGDGSYRSKSGVGYFVRFRCLGKHINVSVSGTTCPITASEIVDAITDPSSEVRRANPYYNRKGHEHFEAHVVCEGHHYMLGIQ